MTARSVLLAATPAASPTVPSMAALFGVASNSAVNAPVCVANAVFCHVAELVRHVPGGGGAVTVTLAVPLCPSLVAVIVAAPTATPRTMPLPSTLATPGALLPQVTARPLRGFPFGSSGVAANCIVAPTTTVPDGGVTATTATAVVLGAVPTGFSHAYTARSAAATVAETTNNGRDRMRGLRIGFLSRASVAGATAGVGDGRACDGPRGRAPGALCHRVPKTTGPPTSTRVGALAARRAWRRNRGSPVALRHRLSTALL